MNNQPVILEKKFAVPSERVWKAITEKDQMKQWYFDIEEFKPEIGFEFRFYGGEEGKSYLHICEVTEVIPFKKIKYSWRYDGYDGKSYVTFTLFQEGSATRLQLKHEGIETFPEDNEDLAREKFVEGWTYIVNTSLKKYLESINN